MRTTTIPRRPVALTRYILLLQYEGKKATNGTMYFWPIQVPGKDDVTGEPLVQRDDDKPEAVRARLEDFCFLVSCRSLFSPGT